MPVKHAMRTSSRRLAQGVLVLGFIAGPLSNVRAERDFEAGGFIGGHYFSDFNELGVSDNSSAEGLDSALIVGARAAVGIAHGFDAELELAMAPTSPGDSDVRVATLGVRAHALYHLGNERVRPFVLLGAGSSSSISDDTATFPNDTDFVIHGGLGLKFEVDGGWGVRADARLLLPPSTEDDGLTTDAELLIGLYKEFELAEVVIRDDDEDGIRNRDDDCPDEAEDMDGFRDDDGCPEDQDSDGDGISDSVDECIDEREDLDDFEDDDGCPDLDNDGDGIEDDIDRCPLEAEDEDEFQDTDGCPDPDNDGDGIEDANDQCPAEPETANGFEDDDGCPDVLPEAVKKFSGEIEGIRFLLGSAEIRKSSNRVLDAAAAVFLEYKDLRFEIQGHTDNTGTRERNATLSQERANSVKSYLVAKGIAADRIVSKGYGQDAPVADNDTPKGREANRRVEFKLLQKVAPAPNPTSSGAQPTPEG